MHANQSDKTAPPGSHDDFGRIDTWDQARADNWAKALDLRAAGDDQVRLRETILDLAAVRPGQTVVEIGCGTGPLLHALAEAVGPTGRVIGVEPQPVLAEIARSRMAERGLADRVQILQERGAATSAAERSADLCIAQTVLCHLPAPDREATLDHMMRITRRGGRVMSADQDAETWVIDHPDRALTRRLVMFYAEQRFADGWTGRRLRGWFVRAGLRDVQSRAMIVVDTSAESYQFKIAVDRARTAMRAGWISEAECAGWIGALEQEAAAGRFFSSLNFYIASGRVS